MANDNANAVNLVNEYLDHRPNDVSASGLRSHVSSTVDEKMASLEKALTLEPENAAARAAYDFLASMAAPKAVDAAEDHAVRPQALGAARTGTRIRVRFRRVGR